MSKLEHDLKQCGSLDKPWDISIIPFWPLIDENKFHNQISERLTKDQAHDQKPDNLKQVSQ